MGAKLTEDERWLIEDMLENGHDPKYIADVTGRGLRTIYYMKAKARERVLPELIPKPFFKRLFARLKGEKIYDKTTNSSPTRPSRRA